MYTAFYGLREKPFSLTPDPRFLFLSASHREALAHILYGIEQGEGFIALTGEVGTGKTTLCRTLLQKIDDNTEVAFVFNPTLSGVELLRVISSEFGLPVDGCTSAELNEKLNQFLLDTNRAGRRALLIIDEAQNLSAATLEEIRLLSNLETSTSKLLQILLFGQPELDDKLDSSELRQLRQRITVRWALEPLTAAETGDYIRHRLQIAAQRDCDLFDARAIRAIRRRSNGIPRLINVLCDRALLIGYADRQTRLGKRAIDKAADEIMRSRRRSTWPRTWIPAVLIATSLALLGWMGLVWVDPSGPAVAAAPAAEPTRTEPALPERAPDSVAFDPAAGIQEPNPDASEVLP
jgi:general secretion pathway protein A